MNAITSNLSAPERQTGGGPELTDACFFRIAEIAKREAGLAIPLEKAAMVRTRIARRLRALQLGSFEAYLEAIETYAKANEMEHFISALTTNVSHFFREKHHFDTLKSEILENHKSNNPGSGPVMIWSAGCANGQEPYSIALTMSDLGYSTKNCKILATDIDSTVLATAKAGVYPEHMLSGLNQDEYQDQAPTKSGARVFESKIKEMVHFRKLNLLEDWPMKKSFDFIFCRNVVIYFDEATQHALWKKFAQKLKPGGILFLGHSERISGSMESEFSKFGVTSYKKTNPSTLDRGM